MTRQSRLLLILGLMAAAGVSSLAFVANQYQKALEARPADASARATRFLEGFLAARQAVRAVGARYPGGVGDDPEAVWALRNERYAAFTAHGMTTEDYAAVRSAWRAAQSGAPIVDADLAGALRARRAALEDAALPPELDALDETIK